MKKGTAKTRAEKSKLRVNYLTKRLSLPT
jgi:hypothetical protein